MSETRKCLMCETDEGKAHPITGRPIEGLVVNNHGTSHICFDCIARCVEIMATDATSEALATSAVREVHEPVFYAEEGIIRSHRAARHRLAAEAKAHQQNTTEAKDS